MYTPVISVVTAILIPILSIALYCTILVQDIRLIDIVGKVVMTFNAASKPLQVAGLPAGIYFLQVQTTAGVVIEKILLR